MLIAIIIISVVGTLLHFTYEFSHHNKIMALFAAVNESTWEHIKIALTPTLLYSLYDGFCYGTNPNYFFAKVLSLLTIILVIPLIFYSYTSLTKKPILVIDILSFYITIALSQIVFYAILKMPALPFTINYIGAVGTFIIFGIYMTATLFPVKNFLFKDPLTKEYGLEAHEIYDKQKKHK